MSLLLPRWLTRRDQENFCMSQKDGQWTLKRDHTYYYQVQTQVNVCKLSYGDFVVWMERGITVERIIVDSAFYETIMGEVHHFFVYDMLLKIVRKWYKRKPVADCNGIAPISSMKATDDGKQEMKITAECGATAAS